MENTAPAQSMMEDLYVRLTILYQSVLRDDLIVQTMLLVVAVIAAVYISRQSTTRIDDFIKKRDMRMLARLTAYSKSVFFVAYLAIFLWAGTGIAQISGLNTEPLRTVSVLVTAWCFIRLITSLLNSRFWARLVSILLWIVAALHIVGWLMPVTAFLEVTEFTFGKYNFSALLIVKGIIAFGILIWAVRFISRLLDRGFRNAYELTPSQRVLFIKLSNVALYAVGIIIGLNIVGLDLTVLTVFGGAVGLGIGIGLQKVFSNFLSGFILLLDKSVKPGDVIAIGDTYGWVNSLNARCVSVLTRDGKEHLIPNEDIITQNVENWSYSDKKVRLHVPISVSYKSDIHLVKKLLLQAPEGHPRILKDPRPVCLVKEFGDSGVKFELRIWIEDPSAGLSNVTSDVFFRIWDLFKENNIEIPFPQRDIHLKLNDEKVWEILQAALNRG